ncbi:hypothetical protein DFH07DRAFT_443774 [Mycena maculata]|uniref:Uncharacterized protein n=1 Tax=Mycena maculata TaxID=230809 RepID=A0AAD7JCA4_9AGAR|nr:hypothetical protein DFH07DRAFT_443774 [Mycena maculata]
MEDPYNFRAQENQSVVAVPSPAQTQMLPSVGAPSPSQAQMFPSASRFGIEGSHFTNVLGNMNIHPPAPPPPPPVFQEQSRALDPSVAGNRTLHSLHLPDDVYSESGSYSSQLLRRGRGFPLYVPQPQRHHRGGVAIGDVGRINSEGIFDFFFNIFLCADCNANRVPEDFCPLTRYYDDSTDVTHHKYTAKEPVVTSSVQKVRTPANEFSLGDCIFDCRPPKGAVLAIPLGSQLEKLENLESMQQYAIKNAESWYKYVNGARGRKLTNGSLYLVTGCEKSRSWGIAAFEDLTTDTSFRLSFVPTIEIPTTETDMETLRHKYCWEDGPARTKDSGFIPPNDSPLDQTLFIHGLSLSIQTSIWAKLSKKVPEVSQIGDSPPGPYNNTCVPHEKRREPVCRGRW